MYGIIANVLNRGGYNLTDITRKINELWVEGRLTDEERNGLLAQAQNGAKTENNLDVLAKFDDIEKRLRALEKAKQEEDPEEGDEAYAEYQEGKWYYAGDTCSFEGDNYVCTAPEGSVCVWSPAAYPAYWEKQ